jgi:lipopolysaccharide/colanic/teichoic acid biosynthesis glycosyltransferase
LSRIYETRREAKIRSASAAAQHILIIGASRLAWFFSKMVEELAPGEYQIVAILDAQPELTQRSLNGYPIIGVPADLDKVIADYARHGVRIDKVVVAERPEELSGTVWSEIVRICAARQIGLEVLPERLMSAQPVSGRETMLSPAVAEIETDLESEVQLSLDRPFWTIKRGIDFVVALGVAVLTFPVTMVVCVLVLIDVGIPIIFWQQRVGRNEAPLFLYKFRTLQSPYDRLMKQQREVPSPSAIGRFLRATRLDELPQVWNILSGDMALIGPRPLLPVDQPKDATVRLLVRPGLSGWAQVCGGNLISTEEKTALDEWYIRHASVRLDAVTVLRTIRMLLTSERRDENAIAVAMLERPNFEARPGRDAAPTTDAPASFADIPYPPDLNRASAGP